MEKDYSVLKNLALSSANPTAEISKLEKSVELEIKKILDFIAKRDAKLIHKACKGIGKDDELLQIFVCNRTKQQLLNTDVAYRQLSENTKKKSLFEKIESELSGNYRNFMTYIVESRPQFNGITLFFHLHA
jgi:hypothetical protein